MRWLNRDAVVRVRFTRSLPPPTMSKLAVVTADALVLIDKATLKDAPAAVPATCNFLSQPTASAWAPDNSCLFIALPDAIEKYDSAGAHLDTVFALTEPAAALVSKDRGNTLIFAAQNEVTVLETHSRKVANKFTTHRHDIVDLALNNDSSLLAAISSNAVHVYNLSLASHTILRGPPSGTFTACAFHLHTRTRLLIGIGLYLAVYDTSRSGGPVKTIVLEKGAGDIVAITCSPFSKTLVAVACAGGNVVLIDLEKEKGCVHIRSCFQLHTHTLASLHSVYRTVSTHIPLTSLVFSPEGGALYAATESGKILQMDLRSLDTPPKEISVTATGQRVVCIAMQVRLRLISTVNVTER